MPASSRRGGNVPSFDALMWPTLKALKAMGGSASNDELLAKVVDLEQIPDGIASLPHGVGGQTKVGYNLAWAKTYLKKMGAIDNSTRGVWSITAEGERLSSTDMAKIPPAVRRQGYDDRRGAAGGDSSDGDIALAADRAADQAADEAADETWKDRLLTALRAMSPDGFERLAQRLLRESGFVKVEVTGRSGDGGIDGVGVLRLNLLSFQVYFQCKRYQGSVGAGVVRDFRGAMVGRSDKGLIITTGTFSAGARGEARRDGAPPIELIDGDMLCELLKGLRVGVLVEMVEHVTVDREWFTRV